MTKRTSLLAGIGPLVLLAAFCIFRACQGCTTFTIEDETLTIEPDALYYGIAEATVGAGYLSYTFEVTAVDGPLVVLIQKAKRPRLEETPEPVVRKILEKGTKIPAGETKTISGDAESGYYLYVVHNPDRKRSVTAEVRLVFH
ncbi:MAG: hypothetical protein ACYTAF_15935 [Planctomycetota bacterium]|jgi:hypothetical protein